MSAPHHLPQYSRVRLTTSRFEREGAPVGTVGWIIEIHENDSDAAYEVEVMDAGGRTTALVVAKADELEVLRDPG